MSIFCVHILHISGKLIPINKVGKNAITKERSNPGIKMRNTGIPNIFLIENNKLGSSFRKRAVIMTYTPMAV
ncbi:unnamed protein product [marine sediment metagenome]|uniref:Uncharacterized protein n=1 Tax=marine sediment metagenome TaxID=412755 RepID=X1RYF3_9ZZZZ